MLRSSFRRMAMTNWMKVCRPMKIIYRKKMVFNFTFFCVVFFFFFFSWLLNFAFLVAWIGFPGGSYGKDCVHHRRPRFNPWVQKLPWRRKRQPTLVFLPGKSQGQRSLVGYSPWGSQRVGHNWASNTYIQTKLYCSLQKMQQSTKEKEKNHK